jgi:hypothetical protein
MNEVDLYICVLLWPDYTSLLFLKLQVCVQIYFENFQRVLTGHENVNKAKTTVNSVFCLSANPSLGISSGNHPPFALFLSQSASPSKFSANRSWCPICLRKSLANASLGLFHPKGGACRVEQSSARLRE